MYRDTPSISDYYMDSFNKIKSDILKENDATIIGTKVEELSTYYFEEYCLNPILFNETVEPNINPKKYVKRIPAHEREPFHRSRGDLDFECEKIEVEIPIIPNPQTDLIDNLGSSTFTIGGFDVDFIFKSDKILFSLETKGYNLNLGEDEIIKSIHGQIKSVKKTITDKNKDIENQNIELKKNITKFISDRVDKLKKDEKKWSSLTKKINIPLKKKENPSARKIELSEKPIVKKVKPSPTQPEEYELDQKKVIDIISFIDNQGRQFEKTPKSYESMGEEALRDVLLVSLNSIFEGKATGETFSKKGKSDIYLNIDKGNILVFECKIWNGEVLYHSTISQLKGYLTWRYNYGVIITFSKNKNFSEILKQMESIIKNDKSFIRGFKKVNETHFISFHSVKDDTKEVEIHHLFYNLHIQ